MLILGPLSWDKINYSSEHQVADIIPQLIISNGNNWERMWCKCMSHSSHPQQK